MNKSTLETTIGALLHDIGKVEYRKGGTHVQHSILGAEVLAKKVQNKNITDCVRFHHASELKNARIPADSPAYAVYAGDNIAAGADRREYGETSDRAYDNLYPLTSVFGTMLGKPNGFAYPAGVFAGDIIPYPLDRSSVNVTTEHYQNIAVHFHHELDAIEFSEDYVNSLLNITELCFSYIPSATDTTQVQDISLYDHVKMTAAAASCINEYCIENGITDYCNALFIHEKEFRETKAFLMYSCDISGIQSFLYNIPSKGALKSLRSRSFSIEFLLEHHIDELLDGCGLSRANLIYSGGGHCYILLPNTKKALAVCENTDKAIREWLIDHYNVSLYFASGVYPCSANDLMNVPADKTPYKDIFVNLSRVISERKTRRYTPDEIRRLNSVDNAGGLRECSVCGRSNNLGPSGFCENCGRFVDMGSELLKQNVVMLITKKKVPDSRLIWPLPSVNGTLYLSFFDAGKGDSRIKEYISDNTDNIIRIYTKNRACTGIRMARNIYVGDYSAGQLEELYLEEKDNGAPTGIKRLAVCRADVDNLGRAFVSGFERPELNGTDRYKYVTVSRAAAFSRQMSMFFRYFINLILKENTDSAIKIKFSRKTDRKVNIVYSGGDDMFLVGLWDDVIEAACDIRAAFTKYCCGALTISAGIGIFDLKYPISSAAALTAELEDHAKEYKKETDHPKNALNLFSPEDMYVFDWESFNNRVINVKLYSIARLLEYRSADTDTVVRGKAMLYHLLELIRGAGDRLNIARYAYALTRLQPGEHEDRNYKEVYREFSGNMYKWITGERDRNELITAITIYLYLTRRTHE